MSSILVVDDEKDLCDLMAESLEDIGHFVLTATGGHEALKLVATHEFDLIITDLKMQNGDGIFLMESLKSHVGKIPKVILITGFTTLSFEELTSKGALAIYQKPLNFDKFFDAIELYLA